MLTIEPKGGLCNRMRAIDSAVSLAEDINSKVRLIWNIDNNVAATPQKLFTEISGVADIEVYKRHGFFHTARKTLGLRKRKTILIQPVIRAMTEANFDFRSLADAGDTHFWTFDAFYPSRHNCQIFKTQPSIINAAQEITSQFENTIGVHIRRSDNTVAARLSPEHLFIERMEQEITKDGDVTFFLTSDDPIVEIRMRDRFHRRIITREKSTLERGQREGIRQALIDLHCLAGTKHILGCANSSFSPVAAALGGVPIHILSLPDSTDKTPA